MTQVITRPGEGGNTRDPGMSTDQYVTTMFELAQQCLREVQKLPAALDATRYGAAKRLAMTTANELARGLDRLGFKRT